MYKSYI